MVFVRKHGVVLMAARGPVASLAEAIAGEPIRGSWWGHPKANHMYRVIETVRDSDQVLVCRLVGGKVTLVHRRLWPALVRLGDRLPKRGLAAIREEHTERGSHRTVTVPFPRWAPKQVIARARRLSVEQAVSAIGADLLSQVTGRSRVTGSRVRKSKPRSHAAARKSRRGRPGR